MTTTALIDGDIILYSVGFASEERGYTVHDSEGNLVWATKYAKDVDLREGETRDKFAQGVEDYVWKGNANSIIKKILDVTGCDAYELYLTGKDNFRNEVVSDYKANRKDVPKPLCYSAMREWLINGKHNGIVVDGIEADDAIATRGYTDSDAIICTTDKDLKMVPARHYNWQKDVLFEVTPEEGTLWFFTQVLMGDKADNIQGLKGVGPVTASKLLEECKTPYEMYNVCKWEYLDANRLVKEMYDNATLLWMQRTGRDCTWENWYLRENTDG